MNPIIQSIPRSGIRIILDEANKLEDVLHLEIGQPDFQTPEHIIAAAHQAAIDGFTGYTPNSGLPTLRQAFADRLEKDYGINVSIEQIVVSVGAMGGLFNAFGTVVAFGDEVLIPDPGYPNYSMALKFLGIKPISYNLERSENSFTLDINKLRSSITRRTRAIVLNSPSNPTGLVASKETIREIINLANENDLYIISDEAYDHILFNGTHHSPLIFDSEKRVISIFSCSKTYAMTGWRIGFVVAPLEYCSLISKMQEAYIACASSISQKAAEAALIGPQTCVQIMNNTYKKRRDIAIQLLRDHNIDVIIPSGAFYLMLKLPENLQQNSMNFALTLLREAKVAVAPGSTFGVNGERYIRLALCTDEKIICEGIKRIIQVFSTTK